MPIITVGRGGKPTLPKRHRKIMRDSIKGITRPAIRRLARRGGVVRMSKDIYDEVRITVKDRLTKILGEVTKVVEHCDRKTVQVSDIIFVLKRMGSTIYGFDHVPKHFTALPK